MGGRYRPLLFGEGRLRLLAEAEAEAGGGTVPAGSVVAAARTRFMAALRWAGLSFTQRLRTESRWRARAASVGVVIGSHSTSAVSPPRLTIKLGYDLPGRAVSHSGRPPVLMLGAGQRDRLPLAAAALGQAAAHSCAVWCWFHVFAFGFRCHAANFAHRCATSTHFAMQFLHSRLARYFMHHEPCQPLHTILALRSAIHGLQVLCIKNAHKTNRG